MTTLPAIVKTSTFRLSVHLCGSLRACRKAVASGWAERELARLKAEEASR